MTFTGPYTSWHTPSRRLRWQRSVPFSVLIARPARSDAEARTSGVLHTPEEREDRNRENSAGDATRHPELELARWAAVNMTADERAAASG
jgi:hypothetical protein